MREGKQDASPKRIKKNKKEQEKKLQKGNFNIKLSLGFQKTKKLGVKQHGMREKGASTL